MDGRALRQHAHRIPPMLLYGACICAWKLWVKSLSLEAEHLVLIFFPVFSVWLSCSYLVNLLAGFHATSPKQSGMTETERYQSINQPLHAQKLIVFSSCNKMSWNEYRKLQPVTQTIFVSTEKAH